MSTLTTTKLSITTSMHAAAFQVARLQPNETAVRRAYTNFLAMSLVAGWCQMVDLDYDWEGSSGNNLALVTMQGAAGLLLTDVGSIECRLINASDATVTLPEMLVNSDSLGCVVLRLLDDNDKIETAKIAEVLGFAPVLKTSLAVAELEPIDRLFDLCDSPQQEPLETPETQAAEHGFSGIPEQLMLSIKLVLIYVPDRSPEDILQDLKGIYQKSDGLYLEIYISDYLKAGRQRSMQRAEGNLNQIVAENPRPLADAKRAELAAIRERSVNPDQDLQMLAADLADQLQELWGWLD
jgi:hypothetical protein